MTKKMHAWSLAALPLAIGLASFSGAANAANFNIGDIEAQFDSQLSVGASWAMENADKRFIDYRTPNPNTGENLGGKAVARTSDDGRLNFKKGDAFSKIFRGVHDLELKYGDSGAFLRGKYWYDFETKDGSQRYYDISDKGRKPLVKSSGVALLDAFVYHNYFIGSNPGNIRLGRQVVSWGESTFIGNSINSINPIDVAAFRRPGAEIKEGLLPVEMLYLSQGITDQLSMEMFYQLKWHPSAIDNCGTFFGSDTLAVGCNDRLVVVGPDYPAGDDRLVAANGMANYIVRAKKDVEAGDDGQWGVAFRYFAPELNDTEFGFYAMNYHSRMPFYSSMAGNVLIPGQTAGAYAGIIRQIQAGTFTGNIPPAFGGNAGAYAAYLGSEATRLAGIAGASSVIGLDGQPGPAGYFFEYPEDIRLYGVSFQTNISGVSVGGELSYRPNMPMQINTGDQSRTALVALSSPDNTHRNINTLGLSAPIEIPGYVRKELWQAQVTAVHFIDQVLGASRLSLVGEAGVNYIGGLGDTTKFGRDSLFGQSPYLESDVGAVPGDCAAVDAASRTGQNKAISWCENDGFYTRWSSGYRVRAALEYSNVFRGINLSPSIAWSHDVDGYGPNFTEDAKSVSLGLNADYANKYNASISYTSFFDGKYNTAVDRDFASVSFSVSF
ncbi:DUF1302 domain-containing protein [Halopseudomonas yangmingensis]|uniref:Adhesin n=1 Tax=Halopseudomonas yangmingensis TaxID=1720063 RepID=A0A1I4S6Z9_9GAMM|nr:DUF1302 domain-containing protein [Halopseudomonas yangmingensis]SFM60272.1 Protein of unknown function [Halopseudomonas yangmingensis]